MTCFKPIQAYRDDDDKIRFKDTGGKPLKLPCGRCIGCRIDYSKDWATRIVHEASLHDDNVFITLTYSPENLPPDCGLIKSDFTKFMKRLRKHTRKKIRFYMCGEYGDENNRPHYHAIIFGYNFDDWVYLFDSPSGVPIYTSPTLEKIWKYGFVTVGEVTYNSAAYVARYVLKKINGEIRDKINAKTSLKHYERINSFTGEIHEVLPEYASMSRRPGIGHDWIHKYKLDVYPKGYTTIRGKKVPPPRYYDKQLEEIDPWMYEDIKQGRIIRAMENSADNTELRLSQKEKVKEAQNKHKRRQL